MSNTNLTQPTRWSGPALAVPDATLPALVAAGGGSMVEGRSGAAIEPGEVAAEIDRVSACFAPGEVVAVWASNEPRWAVVALAAMAAGAIVTGIPPGATPREASAQIAAARADVVVAAPALLEAAGTAAPGCRVVGLDEAATAGSPRRTSAPADAAAVALLPFSSGTTGLPKGVMLTHANLAAAACQIQVALGLGAGDTVLALAPFAHVMGFVVTLAAPLIAGARVITMPACELEAMLALLERERVSVLVVPPPIMAALAHHPAVARHDLSAIELIVSGGAPLGAELQRAVAARFPRAAVGQGYGLTETAVGITGPERSTGTIPGSVGRPLAGTELRVVDPSTDRDLPAGEAGELWVRGPQVMAGYEDRPEATAAMLDADGWLRTGDLGRVDGEGNVFVVDRLKELIKVDALQVAPAELEALLLTHPQVADVAVIPRPDARHGEVPIGVAVPRGALDAEALLAWVGERVARHKRLRAVVAVEAIPRTPAGKVLRRTLIEADRAAKFRVPSTMRTPPDDATIAR